MRSSRLPAIDVLRGVVMILMTVDHASDCFNGGHLMTDSVGMWKPGMALPAAQFFTRWITHLCAPTFVLLAGTALALSTASRMRRGDSPAEIDRHLAIRGVLLIALDAIWMSPVILGPGNVLFQVLYAIGASFLFMIPLRRLSDRALLVVGIAIAVLEEPIVGAAFAHGFASSMPIALLFTGGAFAGGRFIIGYPAMPWLAIMCVGWALGRRLLAWPEESRNRIAARVLTAWGVGLLAMYFVLRGVNGLGNMGLPREDGSIVQWLHVSKYPPSLTYDGLELGIASLLLAALFVVTNEHPDFAAPVRTLGQVALFYYLLHFHVLDVASLALGMHQKLGVTSAYVSAACVIVALAPAVAWYRRYKAAHPGGWRQYV